MNKISHKSLTHAATIFIIQFKKDERDFCLGLQSNKDDVLLLTMQQAFARFKISRNFQLKFDKSLGLERFEPLLMIIQDLDLLNLDSVSLVLLLEEEVSKVYGNGKFLSAASKIAWMLTTNTNEFSNVRIYDSYACTALKSMGLLSSNHTYIDYLKAWDCVFEQQKSLIEDVIAEKILRDPQDVDLLTAKNLNLRVLDLQLYAIGSAYVK